MSKLSWKKEVDENGYATYSMNLFPFRGPTIREWARSRDGSSFVHYLKKDRGDKDSNVFIFRCEEFATIDGAMKCAEQKFLEVFKPLVESFNE